MADSENQEFYHQIPKWKSLTISCLISLISVLFTQFTLFLLPLFLPVSSFFVLLPFTVCAIAIVLGLGRFCKRITGVKASAPAFVFFTIFFTWAVYIFTIRQVISSSEDFLFNIEILMVIIGLCLIMATDPGFVAVAYHSSSHDLALDSLPNEVKTDEEDHTAHRRVRYCRHCKMHILGFDHHCPAFGNCIGQKNHSFFVVLLVGFLIMEASYVSLAFQFEARTQRLIEVGNEGDVYQCLVISTMLFSLIQVLWQVIFLMWHVYCACFNIKTDEWINWEEYPEFQIKTMPHAGQPKIRPRFVNPYNKGILRNLMEFLTARG